MLECEPRSNFASNAFRSSIRLRPQVLAVQLEQIERTMHGAGERAMATDQFKHGKPVFVANDGFTVDQA